jgi:hypothetical protein
MNTEGRGITIAPEGLFRRCLGQLLQALFHQPPDSLNEGDYNWFCMGAKVTDYESHA